LLFICSLFLLFLLDKTTEIDGTQTVGDVKLELKPEFVYDDGVPYLQITHKLTNTGTNNLTGQKFGASADVMIYGNDSAPLTYMREYGALMTDEMKYGSTTYLATTKLRLVCLNVPNINTVNTLWLGTWNGGEHRDHIYEDKRVDVTNSDSALCFSYNGISLNAGESKEFVIRYTQVQ